LPSRRRDPSPFLRALDAGLNAAAVEPGIHILVAVSGGPDSVALLAGLAALAPARGFVLTAGHVDHGLRGAEGAAEAALVARVAGAVGAAVVTRAVAVAPGPELESRARRARYQALRAMAREVGAQAIVTAHTQDDQVETLLMRLVRGAGRRGLGGMRPGRGRLVRPILGATRADVRRFLAERALPFAIDRSNADLRHLRNRVRRLLVPFLEAEFNPRLGPTLAALAARLRDEDDLLATMATARLVAQCDPDGLRLPPDEPPALARRMVREWLDAEGCQTPSAAHVERIVALARGAGRGAVAVPGPGRVVHEGGRLVYRPGREPRAVPFMLPLAPGAGVAHPAGAWRLALTAPRPRHTEEPLPGDARRALFDADLLPAALEVRAPAPGDRVTIPGVGTRKLQDVLVDAKIPREARSAVPVLVGAGEILWVAGVLRGAGARVGAGTTRIVEGTVASTR